MDDSVAQLVEHPALKREGPVPVPEQKISRKKHVKRHSLMKRIFS
jgi:hypothetical protein